jgi:hypothetical protein
VWLGSVADQSPQTPQFDSTLLRSPPLTIPSSFRS